MRKWKKHWHAELNNKPIAIIQVTDSLGNPIWTKFESIDKSQPIEAVNILDQPDGVFWEIKNSHFETKYQNGRTERYKANTAGSMVVTAGITTFEKEPGCKAILFPLKEDAKINILENTLIGTKCVIKVNVTGWVGYATTGEKLIKR